MKVTDANASSSRVPTSPCRSRIQGRPGLKPFACARSPARPLRPLRAPLGVKVLREGVKIHFAFLPCFSRFPFPRYSTGTVGNRARR
jgi:hypothetical protein